MTTCSSDRELVELATGDDDVATRAHVTGCTACAARLAALERDLTLLSTALRDAPAPAVARRRPWMPFAAAAALSAALLLFTAAPWRARQPADVATAPSTTELGDALTAALFGSADIDTGDTASDATDVAAALGGGVLCDGDDCTADTLFTTYE